MSDKTVVITGASGFIGRHCLAPLAAAGYEVHAVSSRPRSEMLPGQSWHCSDLLDGAQVSELMNQIKPSHLLHFAWYAVPGKYPSSPENSRWSQSTLELLQSFANNGGTRAVFAGTCFEYDARYGFCNEELTPSRPSTFYGVCKNSTREIVQGLSRELAISTAWGRIFYLFGPHERPARLIPGVIRALLRGQKALCGHGRQVRDFLHVEDTASAFVSLLLGDLEGTVNIASGNPISIGSLLLHIARLLNSDKMIEFDAVPASLNDPPFLVADIRRLREELGWQPRIGIEEGLKGTIDWWRKELAVAPHENEGEVT